MTELAWLVLLLGVLLLGMLALHIVYLVYSRQMRRVLQEAQRELATYRPDYRLRTALRNLVDINEHHNEAISKIIHRPLDWTDGYLDEARAALAETEEA